MKSHSKSLSAARNHPAYWAFLVHRLSGLALALFLPFHFLVLGLAIEGDAALDGFLVWSSVPLVKLAEAVLVLLLTAHLAGGLRLMWGEMVAWSNHQKLLITLVFGLSLATGLAMMVRVFA